VKVLTATALSCARPGQFRRGGGCYTDQLIPVKLASSAIGNVTSAAHRADVGDHGTRRHSGGGVATRELVEAILLAARLAG